MVIKSFIDHVSISRRLNRCSCWKEIDWGNNYLHNTVLAYINFMFSRFSYSIWNRPRKLCKFCMILEFWIFVSWRKRRTEEDKEKYICRRKIFGLRRGRKTKKEKEENTRRKNIFSEEKKKRGNSRKILGKGKSSFGDEENKKEKAESIWRRRNYFA